MLGGVDEKHSLARPQIAVPRQVLRNKYRKWVTSCIGAGHYALIRDRAGIGRPEQAPFLAKGSPLRI